MLSAIPVISDFTKLGPESTTLTFTASDFTNNFSDNDPEDSLVKIQIENLPTYGYLQLAVVNVVVGQEIPAADLENLAFVPATNWNGITSFTWKGSDGYIYSNSATVTINIRAGPILVGSLDTDGSVLGVSVTGSYASLADYDSGFKNS